MGSVHYLPPEQASGKGSTMQSDIYSMGILMYELLTGTLPFRGENAVEIALKQLKEPIPNLKEKLPDIPNSIVNIVKRATAKNPKNRYTDAREMLDDIKTAMDDSRVNEPIIEFEYPEFEDIDKNAVKKTKEKVEPKKQEPTKKEEVKPKEEVISKKVTEDEVKKENKLLLILGIVFTTIVLIVTAICVLLPRLTSVSNVKVPDVSSMDEVKAEEKLLEEGLKINSELKYVASDTVEEGKVVKTDPAAGRTVKEKTEVTIYVSSGSNSLVLEDYTNKNYIEVKAILESTYKMNVKVEKKAVDDPSEYTASAIIGQSPAAGEKVVEGGTITLYIADIEELYPDFTSGDYTLSEIQDFAKKYSLTLNIKYVETDEYPAGTIIAQSRTANSRIATGASFTISIAQEPNSEDEGDEDD
jgi:serine/threonine-protein kinase